MSSQILIFLTVHSTRMASHQSIRILSICAAIMIIVWSTTRTLNTTKVSQIRVVERIPRMKMLSKTYITIKTILTVKWPIRPVSVIIDLALSLDVVLQSGRVCQSKTACYICKIFRQLDHKKRKGTWVRSKSGHNSLKIRSIKSKTYRVKEMEKNKHLRELLLRNDKKTMKTEWNFL